MSQKQIKFLSEISLIGFSLATISNIDRILNTDNSSPKILLIILFVHLFLVFTRFIDIPTWIRAIGSFLLFLVLESYLFFPSTIANGLPTAESLDQFFSQISDSLNLLLEQRLPITGGEDLQIIYALIIYMVVFLADWTAFIYKKTSETLTPFIALFLLLIYSGQRQNSIFDIALILGTGFIFILFHRLALHPESLNSRDPKVKSRFIKYHFRTGASLAAIALCMGIFLGPAIPGARSEALIDALSLNGNGSDEPSRILLNPLVDIGNRITQNSDVEVFRVKTKKPAYWRLTALNVFDGQIWSSSEEYSTAGNNSNEILPGREALAQNISHSFEISNLGGSWAPSAYLPLSHTIQSPIGFLYNSATSSLITKEGQLLAGDTYTITALQLDATPEEINSISAETTTQTSDIQKYLELPENLSPRIKNLAEEITAEGTTNYEKALLLQRWFHLNFEYSEQVPSGHSENDMIDFLFNVRIGFCEHFSGSFAALARSVGIPTRVAVGFTPGEYSETTPDLLIVKATNAHAWPEVYIPNMGWIILEPTPSRGAPGGSSIDINGIDTPGIQLAGPDNAPPAAEENRSNLIPEPTDTDGSDTGPVNPPALEENTGQENGSSSVAGELQQLSNTSSINIVWLLFFSAAGILLLLYLIGVNIARRLSLMSFTTAGSPRGIASFIWTAIAADLSHVGIKERSEETKTEFSKRAQKTLRLQTSELQMLASTANEAQYSQKPPLPKTIETAIQNAESLHAELSARTSGGRKILKWINPVPAFKIVRIKARQQMQKMRAKTGRGTDRG